MGKRIKELKGKRYERCNRLVEEGPKVVNDNLFIIRTHYGGEVQQQNISIDPFTLNNMDMLKHAGELSGLVNESYKSQKTYAQKDVPFSELNSQQQKYINNALNGTSMNYNRQNWMDLSETLQANNNTYRD